VIRIEWNAEVVQASGNANGLATFTMFDVLGQCTVTRCHVSHAHVLGCNH
jgi:hypothetical protein